MKNELTATPISELSPLLKGRKLSPVELVQAYLSRIDKLNGQLLAYLKVYPEQALDAARQAEREIGAGRWRGPLHGVPMAVKDLYDAAGMVTTAGSAILRDAEPAWEDSFAVAKLKQAGAILLGKLATHEFAGGPTGINPHFGTPRNPWRTTHIAGGSSSGSGVAMAAGLAAGTLGSDTGGSIRIPAHLCNLVGLKPTYGRVSVRGVYPVAATMDHPGPITRTVADCALMMNAIAGHDPLDPYSLAGPHGDMTVGLGAGLKGLRIGVPRNFFFDGLHPDVERCARTAIGVLGELGAELREFELPSAQAVFDAWGPIHLVEWNLVHEQNLAQHKDKMGADIVARMARVSELSPLEYARSLRLREQLRANIAEVMAGNDLIVTPSLPIPAVPIEKPWVLVKGEEIRATNVNSRLTRYATFTGQPALSVPCGFTSDNLPVGLQIIGSLWREDQVLQAAHAYEQASDWHKRLPPVE